MTYLTYYIMSNRWWRFHQFLWPSWKTRTLSDAISAVGSGVADLVKMPKCSKLHTAWIVTLNSESVTITGQASKKQYMSRPYCLYPIGFFACIDSLGFNLVRNPGSLKSTKLLPISNSSQYYCLKILLTIWQYLSVYSGKKSISIYQISTALISIGIHIW